MSAPANPVLQPSPSLAPEDRLIATIFRLLAITFAVVGTLFLLFPNGTVRCINSLGSIFRVFPPAPESELRFWLSLGVSYMALVTVLAAMIQKDPRRYRLLMPILAAGKFCSSFTCLLFFAFASPTFLYLLNFLVDGSITILVLGCYAWTGLVTGAADDDPGVIASSQPILDTLLETLLAADGTAMPAVRETPLVQDLWQYFRQLHVRGPLGLALLLWAIEYGPYVWGPRRRRFTRLAASDRTTYLTSFEQSRRVLRRQLLASLKLIVMLHFYNYPVVQAAVGYDDAYMRAKLLAGPNAEYHGARLR